LTRTNNISIAEYWL